MYVQESAPEGVLWLNFAEKALVKSPEAAPLLDLVRPETLVVAVDLAGVEFVSSLFLQGCVELARALAAQGRELVLLHLAPYQRRVLEMVDGGSRIAVLEGAGELPGKVEAVRRSAPADGREGVTPAEKSVLWG